MVVAAAAAVSLFLALIPATNSLSLERFGHQSTANLRRQPRHKNKFTTVESVCGNFSDDSEGKECGKIEGEGDLCNVWQGLCPKENKLMRCQMPQIPFNPHPADAEPSAKWSAWVQMLKEENITLAPTAMHFNEVLDFLRPTQTQISKCRVCRMVPKVLQCFGRAGLNSSVVSGRGPSFESCEAHWTGIGGRPQSALAVTDETVNPDCFCAWAGGQISFTADGSILDGHHRWAATKLVLEDPTLKIDRNWKKTFKPVLSRYLLPALESSKKRRRAATNGVTKVENIIEAASKHPGVAGHSKCGSFIQLLEQIHSDV